MSQISSINFKKSNPIQTRHNDRDLPPSYLIGGENEVNRNHKEALALRNKIIAKAMQDYTKHTGQKFQAKSYEWSAVVNLKPESTMEDLEKLTEHFFKKYGFQCYQIAIHRDEGHINERGEKIINHHAHLEFITLDRETGKTNFKLRDFPKSKMREIQSEVAEILQMERGQDKRLTGAKRIEPRTYAKMKEQERKNSLELKKSLEIEKANAISKTWENAEQNFLSVKEIKDILEAFRKQSIGKGLSKEFFRELSDKKKNTKEATKEELELFCSNLLRAYEIKDTKLNEQNFKIKSLESDLSHEKQKNEELQAKTKEIDLKASYELLNDNFQKLQKENEDLKRKNRFYEKTINALARFVEIACESPIHGYAYKCLRSFIGVFQAEPTLENYKKTSLKYFRKDFKDTMKIQQQNCDIITNLKSWNNTQKENLKSEIRLNGLSDENRELVEQTLKKEREQELQRDRGFSR